MADICDKSTSEFRSPVLNIRFFPIMKKFKKKQLTNESMLDNNERSTIAQIIPRGGCVHFF